MSKDQMRLLKFISQVSFSLTETNLYLDTHPCDKVALSYYQMVKKQVNLETVCGITSKIPENRLPEIAFAGKSTVGKSSLINALMNRKALARTSSQPGKTQTINFYNINDALYLVDLPGYGYATANEEIKAKWGQMIENYLHTSRRLKAVFLLIDIRHDPSENDILMYDWMLHQGFAPIIIATKADKLKKSQLQQHMRIFCENAYACCELYRAVMTKYEDEEGDQ